MIVGYFQCKLSLRFANTEISQQKIGFLNLISSIFPITIEKIMKV